MANVPNSVPAAGGQGYGKAIIGTMVQPFAGALAAIVIALLEAKLGHPLGEALSTAVDTVIQMPIVFAAVIFTPHDLIAKLSGGN